MFVYTGPEKLQWEEANYVYIFTYIFLLHVHRDFHHMIACTRLQT